MDPRGDELDSRSWYSLTKETRHGGPPYIFRSPGLEGPPLPAPSRVVTQFGSENFSGSVLADGFIGKYWTILWVSLFYAAGQLILTYASTLPAGHAMHP